MRLRLRAERTSALTDCEEQWRSAQTQRQEPTVSLEPGKEEPIYSLG